MNQLPQAVAAVPVKGTSAQLSPDEQVAADIGAALLSAGMVDASKTTDLVRRSFPLRKGVRAVRPGFHLDAWDAGWYQIVNGILKQEFGQELKDFRARYKAFEDRLRPGVYALGFLRG